MLILKYMDKRKLLLLKYLLNNCNDGYKVLDTTKVMIAIKKYKNNYENFEKDIDYLKQMNYIDLKYIDENSLCLSIMDNSRIFQENLKVNRSSKKEYFLIMILTMILSGIMAFLGSFLANIILG